MTEEVEHMSPDTERALENQKWLNKILIGVCGTFGTMCIMGAVWLVMQNYTGVNELAGELGRVATQLEVSNGHMTRVIGRIDTIGDEVEGLQETLIDRKSTIETIPILIQRVDNLEAKSGDRWTGDDQSEYMEKNTETFTEILQRLSSVETIMTINSNRLEELEGRQ